MLPIMQETRDALDPIVTLQVMSNNVAPVASVCFLSKCSQEDDSSDDDDDDGMVFRSRELQSSKIRAQHSLEAYLLASCHTNGDAHLWDLQTKRVIYTFPTKAPGLAMAKVMGNHLAYQTRDGVVTIHTVATTTRDVVMTLNTGSKTFCAMAVCHGRDDLVVLPSEDRSYCTIHDLARPTAEATHLHASGGESRHGMLMSLAMRDSIVACGMEDGTLFIHDLTKSCSCSVKISQEFILGLDLAPSVEASMVAIVGVAANAEDLEERPESERGTVAVVKCTMIDPLHAKLRCRVGTCSLDGGGKPGVDVGRFRPDGRLFAIGGWDKRVRLLDRRHAKPLALLKGHSASVSALDWASNSILASGDKDGTIQVWNVPI